MRQIGLLLTVFVLGACQSLRGEDTGQVMRQDMTAYATEAFTIQQSLQDNRTQVAVTLQTADILAAQRLNYNSLLAATVRAGQEPTQERVAVAQGGVIPAQYMNSVDGTMAFNQIGMAGFVRADDSCVENFQNLFMLSSTDTIYLTSVVENLKAGTTVVVNWLLDGQIMYQSNWSASSDAGSQCVAFALRSSDTTFQVGNWTASLIVDGKELDNVAFSILDS